MNYPQNKEIGTSLHGHVFAAIDADVDLTNVTFASARFAGQPCRQIEIAGTGALAVILASGKELTLPAMPQGHKWLFAVKTIVDSGTTATDIVVSW